MEVFAFLLILLFATHTYSRHHRPSQSNRRLHARVEIEELPDEDPKPPPKIPNPFEGNKYEGDDWPEPDWMKEGGAEEVAAKKPPWETRPTVDEGTLYKPLRDRPKQGDTGLILSEPKDGKQVWLLYLGKDLLGELRSPFLQRIGDIFGKYFRGEDDRHQDRMTASQQIKYIQQTQGGNLRSVLGNLKSDIQKIFDSSLDPIDQADVVQRYPWAPALEDFYKNLNTERGNLPVVFIDNRFPSDQAPGSGSGSKLPSNFGDYDKFGPTTFGSRKRKRSIIDTITSTEEPQNSNSTMNLESDYEVYFEAFIAAQSNASVLILPIIEEMISRSNSSLVWNAAWSLFADLTGSSPAIIGPFSFGFNCIQSLEDTAFALLANSTTFLSQTAAMNGTASGQLQNLSKNLIMATTLEAIEIYNEGWANATAALNQTNLIQIMAALASNLSPLNASVIPSQFLTNTTTSYDNSYFLEYTHLTPGHF